MDEEVKQEVKQLKDALVETNSQMKFIVSTSTKMETSITMLSDSMQVMARTISKIEHHEEKITAISNKIDKLEEHDDILQNSMHTSCEIKTKEIDTKVALAKNDTVDFIKDVKREGAKNFTWNISISLGLFALFIGAVMYFNGENKAIIASNVAEHARILDANSIYLKGITENHTNIATIITTLEKINNKFDEVIKFDHRNSELETKVNKLENNINRNYGQIQGIKKQQE